MKPISAVLRLGPLMVSLMLMPLTAAIAQSRKPAAGSAMVPTLSPEQQDAFETLKGLAWNLKREPDKLAVAAIQARIGDALWKFDEPAAREVFDWSFDAATKPLSQSDPPARRAAYLARQAAVISELLRLFGAHDGKSAEAWLKKFTDEKTSDGSSSESARSRSDLLLQLALTMCPSKPEQAQRLGLLALAGSEVPAGFGRLLFALANIDRGLSDSLVQPAIGSLQRGGYVYDDVVLALCNYLYDARGQSNSDESLVQARLMADFLVEAAWHQIGGPGMTSIPDPSARFYNLLTSRAVMIVARYAPDRLPELQAQLRQLAAGLSPAQTESAAILSSSRQHLTLGQGNSADIDKQIEVAEKEGNSQTRDVLFMRVAHTIMRQDANRALSLAARIDDSDLRQSTEDDINLIRVQKAFSSRSYEEGRKIALKINNLFLKTKLLADLANKVLSDNKDTGRAGELLSEAQCIISKSDRPADKVSALLIIARNFAAFDSLNAFETLRMALKNLNQLKELEAPAMSVSIKPRLFKIKSYTVVNGNEMTSDEHTNPDTIDFDQLGPLAAQHYMQLKLLGDGIDSPLQRARFVAAVASSRLSSPRLARYAVFSRPVN